MILRDAVMMMIIIGIELEQRISVGMQKLFCFSEIRQKEKRIGKEINDWVFVFQS